MKIRIAISTLLASVISFVAFPALSADFPTRPLILVVPFAAGSTSDASARVVAQQMGKSLGQSVTVENRIGAGGTIAATHVARSAPDGYTLLWAPSTVLAIAPYVIPKLAWDPIASFTPIVLVARIPMIIAATNALPVRNFRELVQLARERPGKLSYATQGPNTTHNLAMSLMSKQLGVTMNHVPYSNVNQIYPDLIEGRLDLVIDNVANVLPFIRNGNVRPLAVVTPARLDVLPDVPTVSESVLPNFAIGGWIGLVGPAGIPPEIVASIHKASIAAKRSAEFNTWLKNNGATIVEEDDRNYFATFLPKDVAAWKAAVENSGGLMGK